MSAVLQRSLPEVAASAAPPAVSVAVPRLPHPIPYQGSKRALARHILAIAAGQRFRCFFEPFAGSAAMTIAAAHRGLAERFVVADSLAPLVEIWRRTIATPHALADAYAHVWQGQTPGDAEYYNRVREAFNRRREPATLLYLLARCVKNSPRFNQRGEFNQSPDKRRLGMQPGKMRRELLGASALLAGRTTVACADFATVIEEATSDDLVYLDPPYQGTSTGTDRRYHQGLSRDRLIAALESLNRRAVPFLLSYDGRSGAKTYGAPLPQSLGLSRLELRAGRSTQATLNGKAEETIESLYVSSSLR